MKPQKSPTKSDVPTSRRAPRLPQWPTDEATVDVSDFPAELNPVRVSIARTTDDELTTMSRADLIDLLSFSALASQFAQCTDVLQELPHSGRAGLHLLAMLARRRCRDEVNAICESRGLPLPKYAMR